MPDYASPRNLQFLLEEVLDLDQIRTLERFADFDAGATKMALDAAEDLADQYLFPLYREMDKDKAYVDKGTVKVLPGVGEGMRAMGAGGWLSARWAYDYGGQGMPSVIHNAGSFLFYAANGNLASYGFLTTGAANLILAFGSDELKATYLEKMAAGEWQGTMALTEPQAGSSLSDITTFYEDNEDGSYAIRGQKIYISGGDHDSVDNVVHLLLARRKDGPKGMKGVSLFVVPKYLPTDGGLVDNHVTTAGIYGKMGQKGYVAAHLMFGEQGPTKGFLVGEEFRGLNNMFKMMNEARIGTGLMAAGAASAAYYASLKYASERPQGRHPDNKDVNTPQVLIREHADVRRMLLFQKAVVEGSAHLLLQCSLYEDLSQAHPDEAVRRRNHLLLELLTPVAKSFPSEYGNEAVSLGMQVLGGAGYTDDFPLEQLFRDVRVNSIYEGTTTIHGMDLLGRKLLLHEGAALQFLQQEITGAVAGAMEVEALRAPCAAYGASLQKLQAVLQRLMATARDQGPRAYLADATVFLEYFSLHVIGWLWLRQATVAAQSLDAASGEEDRNFYRSKIHTCRYFFTYVFPRTEGQRRTLLSDEQLTLGELDALLI